jgi:hypothetical protein
MGGSIVKSFRGFIAGVLSTVLVLVMVTTVSAEPIRETITVAYNNIRLTIDGKLIELKDGSGNPIEPFIYRDTNYLPARAISEAVGYDVDWIDNTIVLTKRPEQAPVPRPTITVDPTRPIIPVSRAAEVNLEKIPYNADFQIRVTRDTLGVPVDTIADIFWVPARSLGGSRYTNDEMRDIIFKTPEEKQALIGTLYEALQLYRIGSFNLDENNRNHWKRDIAANNTAWQYGITGYHAVRTNQGDCEGSSNWLNYILKGNYDEVGFIHYAESSNQGHVWNYIKQDGWYYFIDMTVFRSDTIPFKPEESGIATGMWNGNLFGSIFKTRSVEAFSKFYIDILKLFDHHIALMYMYTGADTAVSGWDNSQSGPNRLLANRSDVEYVFLYDDGSLPWRYVNPPTQFLDWSDVPDAIMCDRTCACPFCPFSR